MTSGIDIGISREWNKDWIESIFVAYRVESLDSRIIIDVGIKDNLQ